MKKWSLGFRIWHWFNAVVVLGLLATVFLRKTFLSWRSNGEILMNELVEIGVNITIEQASVLAKAVRAPMWEWHILLGYALTGLLLYRGVLFFTQSGRYNLQSFSSSSLHKKMVKMGYLGIYVILVFMAITGLILNFHEELLLSKELSSAIKEVHELVFNGVWFFVVVHLTGVVIADNTTEKGLISDMINGGETKEKV